MSIDFTAEGNGYFRVFVDEVAVSQHLTEREALERATELELEDSARDVYVERDYRIRVEAEGVAPVPDPPAPEPEPDDPAPDPDPDPEPEPDPPADPDDPVDPPADPDPDPPPVVNPPPTDPSGAFLRVNWDYQTLHNGSDRHPTTYGPDNGHSRQAILAQPGPWGGDRALRNTFYPKPAYTQPQVGTRVDFPAPVQELWLETWLRFSPNWTVDPSFEQPPGTPISNWDHKTLFLFSMDPASGDPWGPTRTRWDVKFGPNGDDCVASGAGSYYEIGHMPPQGGYDWDRYNQNRATRCKASALLWDNQWHQLRVHVRCGSSGLMECWLDGAKFIDSILTPGLTDTPDSHRFWSVWFGGNRNSGPATEMWFEYGPAVFLASDPGW